MTAAPALHSTALSAAQRVAATVFMRRLTPRGPSAVNVARIWTLVPGLVKIFGLRHHLIPKTWTPVTTPCNDIVRGNWFQPNQLLAL